MYVVYLMVASDQIVVSFSIIFQGQISSLLMATYHVEKECV